MFNLTCMIAPPCSGVKPCGAEKADFRIRKSALFFLPGHAFGNTTRMVVPVPGVLSSSMRPW